MSLDESMRKFERALENGDVAAMTEHGRIVLGYAREMAATKEGKFREFLEDVMDCGGGGGEDRFTGKPVECCLAGPAARMLYEAYGPPAAGWRAQKISEDISMEEEALAKAKAGVMAATCPLCWRLCDLSRCDGVATFVEHVGWKAGLVTCAGSGRTIDQAESMRERGETFRWPAAEGLR